MATTVNRHEAKTHLSRLLSKAKAAKELLDSQTREVFVEGMILLARDKVLAQYSTRSAKATK